MSAAAAAAVAANLVTASAPLLMGGEQSAFRSLVPSASSAAVALLAGLRQHQQNQMNVEREYHRRRVSCSSGSEKEEGNELEKDQEDNGKANFNGKEDRLDRKRKRNGKDEGRLREEDDLDELGGGRGKTKESDSDLT